MSSSRRSGEPDQDAAGPDLGEYCRAVEAHLSLVNEGHLVRVVGVAFELVRQWALQGVPLSVVRFGIDRKAGRHRAGGARRPLRLEFCEADVRAAFDDWRRAVGVAVVGVPATDESHSVRRPSVSQHIQRATDRLLRATERPDLPDLLRARLADALAELAGLRERARHARGEARDPIARELVALDSDLLMVARAAAGVAVLDTLNRQAAADLATYRSRMSADRWQHSLDLTVDRLLRERYGLPMLDPEFG